MKKYLFIFLFIPLVACNNESNEPNPEVEKLNAENQKLIDEANGKDSTINSFIQSFNEIEENLAVIKEKEKIITVNSSDKEVQKSKEDQIVTDIQTINELMSENKEMIAALNRNLKKSGSKIKEFEKMMTRLTKQVEEKDIEIASLKDELIKVNSALENLFTEYNDRLGEIDQQKNQLNTAYYVYGTAKELKERGVITKEGGFIGIGRTQKLMKDFKMDYFTKIDISLTPSIPIQSKRAKLLTSHPSGSYQMEGSTDKVEKLLINDVQKFWSVSKYLVIVVE